MVAAVVEGHIPETGALQTVAATAPRMLGEKEDQILAIVVLSLLIQESDLLA